MNLLTFAGAILALVAHVLVAVSIATNYWLVYKPVPGDTSAAIPAMNPRFNDTGLSDRIVRYRASHLGIWTSCYTEVDFGGKTSCGFIDHKCTSDICWVKENVSDRKKDEKSCKRHPVLSIIPRCTSFQAVRGLAVVATLFSILGTTLLFVSLCCDMTHLLSAVGSISIFISAIALLVSFAVFLGSVVNGQPIPKAVASTSWSFSLLIASWVIGIVAAAIACVGALAGSDRNDDSGYSSD